MILSILISSIPERFEKATALYKRIQSIAPEGVEILLLTDNKKRTIGEKRQALLDIANGEYVTWVDDDDDIENCFFDDIVPELKYDLIMFNHHASINGVHYIVSDGIENKNEELTKPVTNRRPSCFAVWRKEIADKSFFPATNFGEDFAFSEVALKYVTTNKKIDKVLKHYIYEDHSTASREIDRSTKKTCVISFSSKGRENYNEKVLNLIDSARAVGYEGDFLIFSPDHHLDEYKGVKIHKGFPNKTHAECPYEFKPALFLMARDMGYEQVIWADSTIKFLRHPKKALDYAGTNGITCYDNLGHPLRYWISDDAKEACELTDEEINLCPQIMACVIVMDFTVGHTNKILEHWNRLSESFKEAGSNREGFRAHRHDQAVLSAILFKNGIPLVNYGELCYPPHHESGQHEVIFLNKN